MPENRNESHKEGHAEQKGIIGRFFSKPSRDETFLSDLKAQWGDLDTPGRVKFVLGTLIGFALFIGALFLAYMALSYLVR